MSYSKKIAYGGFYTAITIILLYLSYILPTSKLTILTLVSAVIPLSIITTGVKNTFIVFLSSFAVSFFIGLREMSLLYLLFFGIYGIIKYYIEVLSNIALIIFLKLIFFNISLGLILLILKSTLINIANVNLPFYSVIILAQFVFFIYDYCLTLIIFYMKDHFKFKI
ncbi:MAG: hypothetical protein WCQ54_04390 [Clostridiaceae bacterium]